MIDGEKLTGIKSGDIAAIFGNALDNAIECAAELPVEKRIISLIGYARQDVMGIHIENYCEDELEFRNQKKSAGDSCRIYCDVVSPKDCIS